VAMQLDDDTRTAFAIIFSRFEGNDFDWETMSYKKAD
jgi:hypothetical protein